MTGPARHDSGLASAVLNVSQQLGGSIGLAVLGNIATSVTRNQLVGVRPTSEIIAGAVTTGFTSAFEIGASIAVGGLIVALIAIRPRRQNTVTETLPEAA